MKRFSKMLALGLAAVLVFGMTAQAAPSPDADDVTPEPGVTSPEELKENASVAETIEVDGVTVTIEAPAPLTTEQNVKVHNDVKSETAIAKVQDEVKKVVSPTLNANETVEFVGEPKIEAAFDLVKPEGLTDAQIKAGVEIPFTLKNGVKPNMHYVALHYLADGSYEVLPATVKDGKVCVVFTSFSPVVIVAQEVKVNTTTTPSTPSQNTGATTGSTTAAADPAVAPKTGEVAPVAGIMALILMAGAVICAKRVRYNR